MTVFRRPALALAAALFGLLGASAAGAQETKALKAQRIQRDIAFARGLATDFGFVGLADGLLDDLLKIKDLDETALNQIRLEKCNLLLLAARVRPEIQRKRELFNQALGEIGQVVERFKGQEMATEARSLYIQGALSFGQVLLALLEDETDPEGRQRVLDEAETIYRNSIKFANDVRASLVSRKDSDSDARSTFFHAWMTQGELLKDWALIAPEADRVIRLNQAKDTLRDFIFAIGQETIPGTRGMVLLAQCYEIERKPDDAMEIYLDVVNNIWTDNLRNPEREIPASTVPLLTRLMEEAYFLLIKINNNLGNSERSVELGTEMISRIEELRTEHRTLQHSFPQGLQALVELARALWDSGQVDRAIRVANDVANQAGSAVVGIEAKKLIRRILEDPAVAAKVDPDVLFQGADAAFREQSYEVCIRDAKKVLRSLKLPQHQKDFGLKTFDLIGRALAELGRHVEATYSYGWGCELYGGLGGGDPRYEEQVSFVASRCQSAAQKAFQQSARDPGLSSLVEYGRNLLFKFGKGEGDALLFRDAQNLAQENKYQEAIEKLRQIPDQSDWYERAQALIGKIYYDMGDFAAATKQLNQLKEHFAKARSFEGESRAGTNRTIAKAQTEYTLGEIAYKRAMGDESRLQDRAQLEEAIRIFSPFPGEFGDQTEMVSFAYYYLGRSWTALGDLSKARDNHRMLKEVRKRSPLIPTLALAIFMAFDERVKAIQADAKATDVAKQEAMRQALAYFDEYLDGNPRPQYAAMAVAFNYAVELGEEQRILQIAEEIRKVHGKEERTRITRFITPRVVEVLQKMGEFNRAAPLVEEMLTFYQKGRWPRNVLWLAVYNYAGWLELRNGEVVEVLGLNEPIKVLTEPYDLMSTLFRGVQAPTSLYTLDWYRIVCQYSYVTYRAGISDSQHFKKAIDYVNMAKSITNFAGVKAAMPLLSDEEKAEIDKLSPAQKQAREKKLDKEREELYQFFLYLSRKLGN